jgi:hypothetical protein
MDRLLNIIKEYGEVLKSCGVKNPVFLIPHDVVGYLKYPDFRKIPSFEYPVDLPEEKCVNHSPGLFGEYDGVAIVEAINYNIGLGKQK